MLLFQDGDTIVILGLDIEVNGVGPGLPDSGGTRTTMVTS